MSSVQQGDSLGNFSHLLSGRPQGTLTHPQGHTWTLSSPEAHSSSNHWPALRMLRVTKEPSVFLALRLVGCSSGARRVAGTSFSSLMASRLPDPLCPLKNDGQSAFGEERTSSSFSRLVCWREA